MTTASELRSGKTHRDENFPVASWIIHPRHRALILAFYNFVRTADDIADHATLDANDKLAYLDLLEAELLGKGDSQPEAVNLRNALAQRVDAAAPCARRADRVPDGRDQASLRELGRSDPLLPLFGDAGRTFHARRSWREHRRPGRHPTRSAPACRSTIICRTAARTIANLNRVYLPRDALAAAGASVEMLGRRAASAALLQCLHALAARTEALLDEGNSLAPR